jgi:alkaline phosphatase D
MAMPISRRSFLTAAASSVLYLAAPRVWCRPSFDRNPFSLGVASGYPSPRGFVLWTRLAPEPLAPGGGMAPLSVPVRFEVAAEERFRKIVAQGVTYATPDWGHSVHQEIEGLDSDRPYWYRFHAGSVTSPTGRTRTAPPLDTAPARLRFALASCQQYEQGYYAAYRHMLADELDLVVHVGDYIYETSWGADHVRKHEGPEPITLEQYRARYARYKSDPDLQAAHAHYPWIVVPDDHEVENDYANARSENDDDPHWFLQRRAAAYQAYYEHMPLRRAMIPLGPDMRIHTRVPFGTLAEFHMLNDREYRSAQPCARLGRGGSNHVEACPERTNPDATLFGDQQERWLQAGLMGGKARWNLLAQQTLMAQSDSKLGDGQRFYTDGWDGYPAARRRLLEFLGQAKPSNPVVLGGDVHSFWVNDLKPDFDAPDSPVVASEFVGTSISSQPPPEDRIQASFHEGTGYIKFATGLYRGYVRFEVKSDRLLADLRALDDVRKRESGCRTLGSWIVDDGRPGPKPA